MSQDNRGINMTKGYLIKVVISLMMMLTAVTAQENVDAIEKARQAKGSRRQSCS